MAEIVQQKLIDEQFKDARPLKTVERIREILCCHGIEIEEKWIDSNVPHCFSLRVIVKGTTFGTNGKGLTKELALASAYGELMERMQLGFVGSLETQKSGRFAADDNIGQRIEPHILLQKRSWFENWSEQLYAVTGKRLSPEQILAQITEEDGKVAVLPVYNITSNCREYFPKVIRQYVYGSNGCAAGNTLEEAIVQAIGEIVERHYKMIILSEDKAVPDIPDEVLQRFKTAYSIITYLRGKGMRVLVKDCSLGTKFPVVCVCYINQKTGKYHTHFGANPILEIALERALTESFQGRNVENFANVERFTYKSSEVMSPKNLIEELVYGVSEKPPSFFVGETTLQWNSEVGFSGSNNRELLIEAIEFFEKQGYEILIQEGSCLGFPTCRVVIPGCSEKLVHRLDLENDISTYENFTVRTFRNPVKAGLDDYLGMILHINHLKEIMPQGHKKNSFAVGANLSVKLTPQEDAFLKEATFGYVHYAMGRRSQAIQCATKMLAAAQESEQEPLLCLKRYLQLVENGYKADRITEILRFFHQEHTVEQLFARIENGNPFEPYVLRCEMVCDENCRLYKSCGQTRADRIVRLVAQKTGEMNFDRFVTEMNSILGR